MRGGVPEYLLFVLVLPCEGLRIIIPHIFGYESWCLALDFAIFTIGLVLGRILALSSYCLPVFKARYRMSNYNKYFVSL